jgi:hypothetical protein
MLLAAYLHGGLAGYLQASSALASAGDIPALQAN